MNITLTERQMSGLTFGTNSRNTANPDAKPMSEDEFANDLLGVKLDSLADEQEAAVRAALAGNDRLMALCVAVAGQPNKIEAIEAAVTEILSN